MGQLDVADRSSERFVDNERLHRNTSLPRAMFVQRSFRRKRLIVLAT